MKYFRRPISYFAETYLAIRTLKTDVCSMCSRLSSFSELIGPPNKRTMCVIPLRLRVHRLSIGLVIETN